MLFNGVVNTIEHRHGRASCRTAIGRRASDLRQGIGSQIRTLRTDAHVSQRRLSDAAGMDQGYMSRIESGRCEPSLAALIAIADALGADLSVRLHPSTGPRIRDHIQARMVEALLETIDPSWHRLVEVPVRRPARGSIDVVLARAPGPIIAVELHSELRRLEQQLRWASEKAASLPSAEAWTFLTDGAERREISRLLVLRSTHLTRELARTFPTMLSAAYPARTEDAVAALTQPGEPWPGAAVLWAQVDAQGARILPGPPRGVLVGR
jgi:transcriptional regulator with XRE-family HTH domain